MRRVLLLLFLMLCLHVPAQQIALEHNFVFAGAGFLSGGVQYALSPRNTMGLYGSIRPWKGTEEKRFRAWTLEAQYRHWNCMKFNGFYFGPYLQGGQYSLMNETPLGLLKGLRNHRYEGWFAGAGMAIGYHLPLGKNWNVGLELGAGYDYIDYTKYECKTCGKQQGNGSYNYWGINKAAISLVYLLGKKGGSAQKGTVPWRDLTFRLESAKDPSPFGQVTDAHLQKTGTHLTCSIQLQVTEDIPSKNAIILVPVLEARNVYKKVELPPIYLNGHTQQLYFERENRAKTLQALGVEKKKDIPLTVNYLRQIPYEPWMDDALLTLHRLSCGCTVTKPDGEEVIAETHPQEKSIDPVFAIPKADSVKIRHEQGKAYICFKQDRTEILPGYLNNQRELDKIVASLNRVAKDSDLTIRKITIEGYASPEGKEPHNQWLSEERMKALRRYIQEGYAQLEVECAGRGENWKGFAESLDTLKGIPQQTELLSILKDSTLSKDEKELRMIQETSQGWDFVLKNLFPWLRVTYYTIEYTVKPFTSNELERVFEKEPHKLSIEEIYRLANQYADNPEKSNAILRKAYFLYPDNSYTNLAMAYLALKAKDPDQAEAFLQKVAPCPEKTIDEEIVRQLHNH